MSGLSVLRVAREMGISPALLRKGIREGKFSFGNAMKDRSGRWAYDINECRFRVWQRYQDGEIDWSDPETYEKYRKAIAKKKANALDQLWDCCESLNFLRKMEKAHLEEEGNPCSGSS